MHCGEYFFGVHRGHLTRKADRIAAKHGAGHENTVDASTGLRSGSFFCTNRGDPFNGQTERAVMADIERAGGIEALLHRRDRRRDQR